MELVSYRRLPDRQEYFQTSARHSFISELLYLWVWRVLEAGKNYNLSPEETRSLPEMFKAENLSLSQLIQSHSLKTALALYLKRYLIIGLIFALVSAFLSYTGPIYIKILSLYLSSEEKPLGIGLLIFFSFVIVTYSARISESQEQWNLNKIEILISNGVSRIVVEKTLRIQSVPEGLGINLIQIDKQRIYEAMIYITSLVSIPIQISIAVFLIYQEIGVGVITGVLVLAIVIVLNYVMSIVNKKINEAIMKLRDERINISKEVFSEIWMIKAYAWESFFKEKLENVRLAELKQLYKWLLLWSTNIFILWSSPVLAAVCVFLVYTQVLEETLTPEKAFITLSSLFLLQRPFRMVPFAVTKLVQARESIKRIQKLLDIPDLPFVSTSDRSSFFSASFSYTSPATDPSTDSSANVSVSSSANASASPSANASVSPSANASVISSANASVNPSTNTTRHNSPVLKSLSFDIKPGELLAVIGPVGSGKTSLINALMGELPLQSGSFVVDKNKSFAPSLDSWLMNDTVRNNIVFGEEFKEEWFEEVVEACSLSTDLKNLPGRDLAEIGEKGINLSGGQKARVCLARAVYSQASTILMDDPLSSVDTQVANHIVKECISGLLKNKTRVLITHRLEFLDKCDRVLKLEEGSIKDIFVPESNEICKDDSEREGTMDIDQDTSKGKEKGELTKLVLDEEKQTGTVNKHVYYKYFSYSGGVFIMIATVLVMLIWTSCKVSGDTILRNWSESDGSFELIYLYCLLSLGGNIFVFFRCFFLLNIVSINASKKMHSNIIDSLLKAPVNLFYNVTPTGRIINRLTNDLNIIDETVALRIGSFLARGCNLLSVITMQMLFLPWVIILLPMVAWLCVKCGGYYITTTRELTRYLSLSKSKILHQFTECISGNRIIRCFSKKQYFTERFFAELEKNTQIIFNMNGTKCWMTLYTNFISSIFICSVVAMIIIFRHHITAGVMGLCIAYTLSLPDDVFWSIFNLTEIEKSAVSLERVEEYSSIPSEFSSGLSFQVSNTPSILFKNVSMKYRPDTSLVLKNVTFYISPCQRVGIVGRTGSGKSSLLSALLRIVELKSGAIFIQGTNIASISLQDLRQSLTLVPQDPLIFNDSLRNNLDPRNTLSDDLLHQVLRQISLDRLSLDFQIEGKGKNLSAGEKQLISLGRALTSRNKVLMFDEATAGIDTQSDSMIQKLIRSRFTDCSILVIAHRIETIMDSDKIIVMKDGSVDEEGNLEELLEKKGEFYWLVNHDEL